MHNEFTTNTAITANNNKYCKTQKYTMKGDGQEYAQVRLKLKMKTQIQIQKHKNTHSRRMGRSMLRWGSDMSSQTHCLSKGNLFNNSQSVS